MKIEALTSPKTSDDGSREQEYSKQSFQYGNISIAYSLVKSKRRKTCEVIVDKNSEIILRVPFDKTSDEIDKILNDKIKWAITKQKEYHDEIKEIIKPTYENNSTLPYLGKNYELQITYIDNNENQNEKIEFIDNKFNAYIFGSSDNPDNSDSNCNNDDNEKTTQNERVRELYNNWLYSESNKIFIEKVNQHKKIVDVNPKRIVIKNLKNRWGSLTKNDSLHLNFNLIKASEEIIDYIIIHELCHLKIKGHSYHFWDYLKQFVPDYQRKMEWLGRNSDSLLS